MKKIVLKVIIGIIAIFTVTFSSIYATDNSTTNTDLPTSFDLRSKINIKVENQGQRGWCSAYTMTKVIETNLLLTKGVNYNLSEAYLAYSEAPYFGGETEWKTDIITARALVSSVLTDKYVLESEIPNRDYEFNETNKSKLENAQTVIKSYKTEIFDSDNKIEEIKNHIMCNGGVYLSINASEEWYNSSTNAIYSNVERDIKYKELNTREEVLKYANDTTNHSVTIIGWNDNYSKNNFKSSCRPENDGAWLIVNSWGSNWGDNGTAWVSYEDINFVDDVSFGVSNCKVIGEKPIVEFTYSQRDGYVQGVIKSDEKIKIVDGWDIDIYDKSLIKRFDEPISSYSIEIHSKTDDTVTKVEVNIPEEAFKTYDTNSSIQIEGSYKLNSQDLRLIIMLIVFTLIVILLILIYRKRKNTKIEKIEKQHNKIKKILCILVIIIIVTIAFVMYNEKISNIANDIDIQEKCIEFTDTIKSKGQITYNDYYSFIEELNLTGNGYNIVIEVRAIEDFKTIKNFDKNLQVGENESYTINNNQILETLNTDKVYKLKEGNSINIEITNSRNEIVASHSGLVVVNGN